MNKRWLLSAGIFFFVVGAIATLSWLTQSDADPCANPNRDVSGAALGGSHSDQEGLVNRALIVRGNCEQQAGDQ